MRRWRDYSLALCRVRASRELVKHFFRRHIILGGDTRTQIIFIMLRISYYNFNNTVLSEFLCFRENTLSDTIFRFSLFTRKHDSYCCAIITIITKVGLGDLIISVFCESISLLLTVDDYWNIPVSSSISVILSNSL